MKANPRHAHFLEVLEDNASAWLKPWTGDVWRFQSVRFPTPNDILSGNGAFLNGGRWNGIKTFPAVYGSANASTAVEESGAVVAYAGFPMREPRLFVAIWMYWGYCRRHRKGFWRAS